MRKVCPKTKDVYISIPIPSSGNPDDVDMDIRMVA